MLLQATLVVVPTGLTGRCVDFASDDPSDQGEVESTRAIGGAYWRDAVVWRKRHARAVAMLISEHSARGEPKMLKRLIRFEMVVALLMAVGVGGVAFAAGRAVERARD